MKQSDKPHPGINYHKFSVGGHWEGVFIVIACSALLFAIHTPFTGLFLIFSVLLGIVIGLFLRLARRDKLVNTHTFLPLEAQHRDSTAPNVELQREPADCDCQTESTECLLTGSSAVETMGRVESSQPLHLVDQNLNSLKGANL
jgi:hypothetical protein